MPMNSSSSFEDLKDLRILLVDDDELIRDSLSLVFKNRGCHLQAHESAEEALQTLHAEHFDIIISDFKLPGIDGLNFFKAAVKTSPDSINILITAYREKGIVAEAFRSGVHDFIEKPFSPRKLVSAVHHLATNRNLVPLSGESS
jgi:DNA-binding NtrC family response regulator